MQSLKQILTKPGWIEYEVSFEIKGEFVPEKSNILYMDALSIPAIPKSFNFDELMDLLNGPANLAHAFVAEITSALNQVQGYVNQINDTIQNYTSLLQAPMDVMKQAQNLVEGIAGSCRTIKEQFKDAGKMYSPKTQADKTEEHNAVKEYIITGNTAINRLMTALAMFQLSYFRNGLLPYSEYNRFQGQSIRMVIAKEGDTIKRIARKYTSSVQNWYTLMEINNLETQILTSGMRIIIPRIIYQE